MAKTRFFGYKGDENYFKKRCNNPDCEREFYISGRYDQMTKFCSDSCRNHTQYMHRKDYGSSSPKKSNESVKQITLKSMEINEAVKEIISLNKEISALQSKIVQMEHEMDDNFDLRAQVNAMRNTIQSRDREIQSERNIVVRYKGDLITTLEENEQLKKEIAELEKEFTQAYEDREQLNEEVEAYADAISKLQGEKKTLLWALIEYSAFRGTQLTSGKVKLSQIYKYFSSKDYPKESNWQYDNGYYIFKHMSEADTVNIIKKPS